MLLITKLVTLILWAIIGFLFWIPLLFRTLLSFSTVMIISALADSDIHTTKYRELLDAAVGFYARGFSRIHGALTPHNNINAKPLSSSIDILNISYNTLFTIVFWLLTTFIFNPYSDIFNAVGFGESINKNKAEDYVNITEVRSRLDCSIGYPDVQKEAYFDQYKGRRVKLQGQPTNILINSGLIHDEPKGVIISENIYSPDGEPIHFYANLYSYFKKADEVFSFLILNEKYSFDCKIDDFCTSSKSVFSGKINIDTHLKLTDCNVSKLDLK